MEIQEIREAANKQPEIKTAIISSFKEDFIKGAEAEGLIIRTKEQDQQYLDTHVKTVVDGKIAEVLKGKVGEEFGKAMNQIDSEIKGITGVEKNNGEKTTDYAKRALAEIKSKGGDAATKERVSQLEKLLHDTKTDLEKQLTEEKENAFKRENEFQVSSALDKVNIAVPIHLKTDAEKQAYVNQQKALIKTGFLTSYKSERDSDGNIIYKEDGKPLLNIKDGKPQNASDIIGSKYSAWFVPEQAKVTGTGTGQQSSGGGQFKTSEDVHNHLKANGIDASSEKYLQEFEKLTTENHISV
jgi:hypothetical protein